jgi:2-polyprenyl-6-methoxyphenol hydroxylase-like FAD-dependent oxidoreductase
MSAWPSVLIVDTSVTGVANHIESPKRSSTGTEAFSGAALTATILETAALCCQAATVPRAADAPERLGGPETVAIVGAGIGGLALAQSLAANGIPYDVYERDASFVAPGRTVRIHCRPSILESARQLLPPDVQAELVAVQGLPDARYIYLDEQLRVTEVEERAPPEVTFDTTTLREVLSLGLDRLHFGRGVSGIELAADRSWLAFADGSEAVTGLVVGADGLDAITPSFTGAAPLVRDVGLAAVYGVADLDANPDLEIPEWLHGAFAAVVSGDLKVALALYEPLAPAAARVRARRYLFWNVIAPRENFAPPGQRPGATNATHELVLGLLESLEGWVADVARRSSPASLGFLPLMTCAPSAEDAAPGLVLIGDAAHPMLPASLSTAVAFEDARVLGEALSRNRDRPLRERAEAADAALRDAAFARVREAELLAGPAFGIRSL